MFKCHTAILFRPILFYARIRPGAATHMLSTTHNIFTHLTTKIIVGGRVATFTGMSPSVGDTSLAWNIVYLSSGSFGRITSRDASLIRVPSKMRCSPSNKKIDACFLCSCGLEPVPKYVRAWTVRLIGGPHSQSDRTVRGHSQPIPVHLL